MPSKRLLVEENIKKQIPFRFLPILEKKSWTQFLNVEKRKKERKKELEVTENRYSDAVLTIYFGGSFDSPK